MLQRVQTASSRFHTNQLYILVLDVWVKNTHGIGATTHRRQDVIRLTTSVLGHLLHALITDHALEIAHHHRVRMRASHRTNNVEGIADIGDPIAHGFVQRIFQGTRTGFHRNDRRTQQLHAVHIGSLTAYVFATHVDHTFQTVASGNGCRCHAVLACAGFSNNAWLAHAASQQNLTDTVVDLVCASVIEIFALEPYLSST